jgi:predicted nucleic acid-binding protein
MNQTPPFNPFETRYRASAPLAKVASPQVERFFNSVAVFVTSEVLSELISSYEAVRYDLVNDLIVTAHRQAAMELGRPALFRMTRQLLEWNTCYIDDVGHYLVEGRNGAPDRLSFLEYLLFYISTQNLMHWPAVEERIDRFLRAASIPLRYRNLQFQPLDDERLLTEVTEPFWRAVEDAHWKSVRADMEQAFRQRDGGGPNAALFAAKALESAIKIVSDDRGFTSGRERGAASFVDNLVSARNGRLIAPWEGDMMKRLFSDVRNPEAHGAGSSPQPELDVHQVAWVIEFCMISIKGLVARAGEGCR